MDVLLSGAEFVNLVEAVLASVESATGRSQLQSAFTTYNREGPTLFGSIRGIREALELAFREGPVTTSATIRAAMASLDGQVASGASLLPQTEVISGAFRTLSTMGPHIRAADSLKYVLRALRICHPDSTELVRGEYDVATPFDVLYPASAYHRNGNEFCFDLGGTDGANDSFLRTPNGVVLTGATAGRTTVLFNVANYDGAMTAVVGRGYTVNQNTDTNVAQALEWTLDSRNETGDVMWSRTYTFTAADRTTRQICLPIYSNGAIHITVAAGGTDDQSDTFVFIPRGGRVRPTDAHDTAIAHILASTEAPPGFLDSDLAKGMGALELAMMHAMDNPAFAAAHAAFTDKHTVIPAGSNYLLPSYWFSLEVSQANRSKIRAAYREAWEIMATVALTGIEFDV